MGIGGRLNLFVQNWQEITDDAFVLSVNKKGYTIHYKRDVSETMVNTYNPEWIQAWNGNMDFQLCLDYFAVITYISDYYCKDDTGTMQVLQEALRESMHEDLHSRLKKMVSV